MVVSIIFNALFAKHRHSDVVLCMGVISNLFCVMLVYNTDLLQLFCGVHSDTQTHNNISQKPIMFNQTFTQPLVANNGRHAKQYYAVVSLLIGQQVNINPLSTTGQGGWFNVPPTEYIGGNYLSEFLGYLSKVVSFLRTMEANTLVISAMNLSVFLNRTSPTVLLDRVE